MEKYWGVWAEEAIQVIFTSKIILIFEKVNEEVLVYACKYEINGKQFLLDIKAGINFNQDRKTSNCLFRSADKTKLIQWGDKDNKILEPQTVLLNIEDNKYSSSSTNLSFELAEEDDLLKFVSFNNVNYLLKKVKKIEVCEFTEQAKANKENIGYCLANWNKLAVIEQGLDENEVFSCRIILQNCDFHLNIIDNSMIYCNSNLLASNNNGRVWDQKIRLMNHKESNQFSILFPVNCYDSYKTKLFINDSLFKKDSCNFLPGMLRYWSLDSFTDDRIVINGCGEKYTVDRISEDPSKEIEIEFFK